MRPRCVATQRSANRATFDNTDDRPTVIGHSGYGSVVPGDQVNRPQSCPAFSTDLSQLGVGFVPHVLVDRAGRAPRGVDDSRGVMGSLMGCPAAPRPRMGIATTGMEGGGLLFRDSSNRSLDRATVSLPDQTPSQRLIGTRHGTSTWTWSPNAAA